MERSGYGRSRRFGRSEFRPSRPVPVEEGKEYDVKVESIGSRGDGIAKVEGFIVFVPGAKVGDNIRVRITTIRGRFAIASPVTGSEEKK
jgi:predicted RNA-binding protein with TRAM domain